MKKTPTIFKRNPDDMKGVLNEPHPSCEWVFNGEGVATRKYDGTCCLIKDGILYKRRELKKGKRQPDNFILADYDEVTGKTVGWVIVKDGNDDRWHMEAFYDLLEASEIVSNGTYELCGPKVQGNPENYDRHVLVPHSEAEKYDLTDRSYSNIEKFLSDKNIEGLVFHHPDGRMAKIKKRDFGLNR